MIKKYLENNVLVTDGAMGTYYSQMANTKTTLSELANIENPEAIQKIHRQYIKAGAKLIRTNTFSVNRFTLDKDYRDIERLIHKGFNIAKSSAKDHDIFIAADIGPIPDIINGQTIDKDVIIREYLFIIDAFLESGADIFTFETLSSTDYLKDISQYIKLINPNAFIIAQFALNTDGYTRKGISYRRIQSQINHIPTIDAYGFNCSIGPTHLYNILKNIDFSKDIISALPNSGYPMIINERTVYTQNPKYFAEKLLDIKALGAKIIGGCCGTTPLHIQKLSETLNSIPRQFPVTLEPRRGHIPQPIAHPNPFKDKLKNGEFTVAVELAPPFSIDLSKIISGAQELKDGGVDIITVSDSPMARVRADSTIVASKIKREVGIDTMPHICCRDKNIIGLKSALLGAHTEGLRNLLIVTGDPVPSPERVDIKSVFNLNSMEFMGMVEEMNQEIFASSPYFFGGALNLNVLNTDIEIKRMKSKIKRGAKFFLTQPVFQNDTIELLRDIKSKHNIKILAGIMPIVSYKNAIFLNNEVPGINIPEECIKKFSPNMSRQEAEDIGVNIAASIVNKIKAIVDGIYFMTPFNRTSMIVRIINKGLR